MLNILYEDQEILVTEKPAGMEAQSSRRLEPDMVSEIKNYLKISTKLSTKPSTAAGEPYVGVVHRLDRPVGGIMVYAKTQRAAAVLSRQVKERQMRKLYHAVVCGKPVDIVGNYVDFLLRDGKRNLSQVVDKSAEGSKRAELNYRVLKEKEKAQGTLSLVEVELLTGRHHQIRVQFASRGTPLWGDNKYNPACERRSSLALYSTGLSFEHPVTGKWMEFTLPPRGSIFREFENGNGGQK